MRTGRHEVVDSGSRVAACHQTLSHQHRIRTCMGVGQQIVRTAYAGLRDAHAARRDGGRHTRERVAVDLEGLEVADVDTDDGMVEMMQGTYQGALDALKAKLEG